MIIIIIINFFAEVYECKSCAHRSSTLSCAIFTCGMLSELIDFELANDDLKMSTEESARLSWEIESRSKLSQLMLNLIDVQSIPIYNLTTNEEPARGPVEDVLLAQLGLRSDRLVHLGTPHHPVVPAENLTWLGCFDSE